MVVSTEVNRGLTVVRHERRSSKERNRPDGDGLFAVAPAQSIQANVAADLVRQGIPQARRRGIVSAKDEARLLAELGSWGRTVAAR